MKKIIGLMFALFVFASCLIQVGAAQSNVIYNGKSEGIIFEPGSEYSPTDLFSDFKDVMPGDSIEQKITVKNDASKEVKVKIFIRSSGAQTESADFLSKLTLKVEKSNKNGQAYMFDAKANETAQLTDWVELGTLYSGGTVDLNVILDIPTDLDNNYKNAIDYLDWEFMVEELPIEENDPEPPKTGDNSNIYIWSVILICSAVLLLGLILWRKKDK